MARRHWLVSSYLALSDRGDLSEPEGRALLKRLYPKHAGEIDGLVSSYIGEALGTAPRLADDADNEPQAPQAPQSAGDFNARLRDQFIALREGNKLPDSGDMNASIRNRLNQKRLTINRESD
jgi:hypothetical protein